MGLFMLTAGFTNAQEASFDYSQEITRPFHTKLIEKKNISSPDSFICLYGYSSELSREEIAEFYRDFFSPLGFKEKDRSDDEDIMFSFNNGVLDRILLNIYYTDEENITFYKLDVVSLKYLITTSGFDYKGPKRLNFAPVNQKYTQFILNEIDSQHKIAQYFTFDGVGEVADFYIKNMASYGWSLAGREEVEGIFNVLEAISRGFYKNNTEAREVIERVTPNIEGEFKTLVLFFEGKGNNCTINITQFKDYPADLRRLRIINPDTLKKYGDVFITLACGY